MKEIKTNGIEVLFVEVPEDAKEFDVHHNVLLCFHLNDNVEGINLPIGQYQILGKSTELSEEQMKEICEHKEVDSYDYYGIVYDEIYRNYLLSEHDWKLSCDQFSTVQESYLSLLEANGIVDRCMIPEPEGVGFDSPSQEWDEWQEAQSKVKHYLVLKRI